MASIKIVTDSTADIPPRLAQELDITIVPMNVHVHGQVYRSGVDLSQDEFYAVIHEGAHALRTSAPSSATFETLYRKLMGEYDTIFSIHLSSKMGGVYRSALQARSKLPASLTQINIIDSKLASMGLGMVVLAAAQAARAGATVDEIQLRLADMMRHTHVVFFVDTMEHLEHGGRLSLGASVLGSIQRIKPLLILDDGEIVPYERTRTRAKAIENLYTFVEDFPNVIDVSVLYTTTPEDVERLLEKLEPIFPRNRVNVIQFGPATAIHLGPGAMGVSVYEGID